MTSDEIETTERGRILNVVRGELSFLRRGRVVTVWPHTGSESTPSNHEVDVAIPPGEPVQEPRRVPVRQPTGGAAFVPQEGDMVLVGYLQGSGERPVVLGAVYGDADDDRAPIASAGDIRLTRGDLAVELAGDGSAARLALRPDATTEPDLVVEVAESGTIRLGKPDGSLKPIAREGDTVEVSDPDSGTLTGEITGGSSDVKST